MMPKRGEMGYDKLYKIRPFLTKIKQNFQKYYNPHRIVAVDESMIKFKGRSTLKQYVPNKPIKRGYKVWSLVDQKGYLWNFDIYILEKLAMLFKQISEVVLLKIFHFPNRIKTIFYTLIHFLQVSLC